VLLLTLRGTPFLYQGEELGLEDATVPPERRVDPGGRDGCRAPIPWTGAADHGWGVDDPWLPWPPDASSRNVQDLRADDGSILHLYCRLLRARRGSDALRAGSFRLLPAPAGALAWERVAVGDRRIVAVNFTDTALDIALSGSWVVEVASDGAGEGVRATGRLAPDQAVVLREGAAHDVEPGRA
jgi:alpha-glucosidase